MSLEGDRTSAAPHGHDEPREAAALDEATFRWEALIPVVMHPVKVAIVEAMLWMQMPLSARGVQRMFEEPEDHSVSVISFHMRSLAGYGAVDKIGSRSVRGAQENFYFLSPAMIAYANGAAR